MTSLQTQVKAETIKAALYAATGIRPDVIYRTDGTAFVTYNPDNAQKIGAFIENQLKKTNIPDDVQIDFFPFVKPVLFKQILPAAGAAIVAIFAIGYFFGSR